MKQSEKHLGMLQHDFSDRRPAAAISKGVEGLNKLHWVVTVLAGSAPTRRIPAGLHAPVREWAVIGENGLKSLSSVSHISP